jgi:hypothetical protein
MSAIFWLNVCSYLCVCWRKDCWNRIEKQLGGEQLEAGFAYWLSPRLIDLCSSDRVGCSAGGAVAGPGGGLIVTGRSEK